jgi:hypothetical protein
MIQSQASILVKLSPQQVYDFVVVGFSRNYRRWSPEVQRLDLLTPGPLRVGSRARQVRVDQGRRSDNTFRVVALDPPTKVCFNESNDRFRTEYRMEPVGEGTRLTFVFELRRLELYMRPFEKRIRTALQEGAERVVGNIKDLAERESSRETSRRA